MEYRPFALGAGLRPALLFAALCGALPALAAADDAVAAKRQRAGQLEREAQTLRAGAAADFRAAEVACQQRWLVNDCIRDAKEKRLARIVEARRKESEQAALEREIRYAELAARRDAKLRQRAEEGPPPAVVSQPDRAPPEARPLQ